MLRFLASDGNFYTGLYISKYLIVMRFPAEYPDLAE